MTIKFPLRPGSKAPLNKGWNTATEGDTAEWFEAAPENANTAIRTDNLVVVDCDSDAAIANWEKLNPPATFTVQTPRGRHYYYARPDDCTLRPGPLGGNIDIKTGAGAYVVGPGSTVDGKGYVVLNDSDPAPAPIAAIEGMRPAPETTDEAGLDRIGAGQRNSALASIGGAMRKHGLDVEMIAKLLLALNNSIVDPPLPQHEVIGIAKSLSRYDFEIEVDTGELSDLVQWVSSMTLPPPPEWWWFPYVPKSRLVLLDGSEGIGKGLFCVWLAKQLTSGTFPDTDDRGRVLWLSAEDDPEEDILRRLYAAGYDTKDAEGIGFITQMLKVPSDVAALEALIYEHKASVLIMDPGRSFLSPPEGTKDFSFNNEAHVRPGMEELNRLAKRTSCTILFVHHWNKNTTADIQYRSGGSGAFAQVVRHRVTLAWHGSTEEGEGAFEVQKSNIASRGHVHGYRVDAAPAWDTATFALSGDMPEFQSLGEWFKACATDQVAMDYSDVLSTVLDGHVARGARIPSEAELMNELGISRRELRAATITLIEDGILLKDHGQRRPVFKGLNP